MITIKYAIPFGDENNKPVSVHSKIFLLNNDDNSETRVIIGSANLTEQAFEKEGQFEEVMIFDNNNNLYQIYRKRIEVIDSRTSVYIPEFVKKLDKGKLITDEDVIIKIIENPVPDAENTLVITQKDVKEWQESFEGDKQEVQYKVEKIEKDEQIFKLLTQRKGEKIQLKPQDKLVQNRDKIIQTIKLQTSFNKFLTKSEGEIDNRIVHLGYNEREKTLFTLRDGSNSPEEYSRSISNEDLKKAISIIGDFIKGYEIFTVNPDISNQSKVFEAILYAFMSPFIWKIRADAEKEQRESVKKKFTPFLIIGGKADSGKTTLFEFISMLLGINPAKKYMNHVKVESFIPSFFNTEYLFPLLIDEVPNKYFESKANNKGESLIKYVTNELKSKHPVFIGNTNVTEFNVSSQILTRIYYLQIDKTFNKAKQTNEYLKDIFSSITDALFRDFTYRISELLKKSENIYSMDDMLSVGRKIFRDYYREANINLPLWFPDKIFTDYEDRGSMVWKNIYFAKNEAFKHNKKENTILVDMNFFTQHPKEKLNFKNYLTPSCIKEDGVILVLWRDAFLTYIGKKPENTIWDRLPFASRIFR